MATGKTIAERCLVVLSGIPGCGKSSLAGLLHRHFHSQADTELGRVNVIVVPYDELISNDIIVYGETEQTWKDLRERIVLSVEKLLSGDSLPEEGNVGAGDAHSDMVVKFGEVVRQQQQPADLTIVVIDDNMYYSSMRYRYYQLARKYACGFCQLYIQCDMAVAQQRNAARHNPVPDDIIVRMAKKIETPNSEINSWEANSVILDGKDNMENFVADIFSLIKKAVLNPVQPIEEVDPAVVEQSRQISLNNAIHQSDQILRKIVSQKMADLKDSSCDKATLQRQSKMYMETRKTCLEKVRSGHVCFPVAVDQQTTSCDVNSELYQQILRLFEQLLKEVT